MFSKISCRVRVATTHACAPVRFAHTSSRNASSLALEASDQGMEDVAVETDMWLKIPDVSSQPRTNWTIEEVKSLFKLPLLELVYRAGAVHRANFDPREVQQATLCSIKTGGCSENCGYCSQSQHHKTFVKPTRTMKIDDVLAAARRAKEAGTTRFCMGSAWREVGRKNAFKDVLKMVEEVNAMGLEVCTTLGMLDQDQAKQLKAAGLTAYNHNLDTSREFYPKVVQTRTYDDRLKTIDNVQSAGVSLCTGGIIGLGESENDRISLLHTLATLDSHPGSVSINCLVPVEGTPIGDKMKDKIPKWDEMVKMIAVARILFPKSMVRLSAGRQNFDETAQGMMFLAGANSVFMSDQLFTVENQKLAQDREMFKKMGLKGKPPHKQPLGSIYTARDVPRL